MHDGCLPLCGSCVNDNHNGGWSRAALAADEGKVAGTVSRDIKGTVVGGSLAPHSSR